MPGKTFVDKCFRDKEGRIAIFQPPNTPLILWFVCVVLNRFTADSSTFHKTIEVVGFGALFTWAWLEIFYGTNYFRRFMGMFILLFSVLLHSGIM